MPTRSTGDAQKMGEDMLSKLPMVDDLTFWLAANALVFLFVGSSQLYSPFRGPGTVYSALAILVGLFYGYMAWVRKMKHPRWVSMVAIFLPALILLIDVILTASLPSYSIIIEGASLLLIFFAYSDRRNMKMQKPMS